MTTLVLTLNVCACLWVGFSAADLAHTAHRAGDWRTALFFCGAAVAFYAAAVLNLVLR
jgi:hypothetical protein